MISARVRSDANGQEVLEPFGDSSLCDPQPAAGEAKHCSGDRSALRFGVERRERLLCRVELALIDERLDEHTAVQHAVHGWCGELGRGKCRPRVSLGGDQIAASEREPAAVAQADGKPAAVAGRPRLRDRGIEQRPHLGIPLGPKQRERRLREPGCEREPRPARRTRRRALSGQKRAGRKLGADLGRLVREDGDERGRRPAARVAPPDRRAARSRNVSRRRATEGAVAGSFIAGTTAAASSRSASSEWPRVERRRRAIENLDRLREALSAAEREPEHHRCFGGCRGVRRGVHGLLQVLGPVGEPGARLGHSEVEQQCRPVARRRWFGERSAQEDGLRLGSALLPRRAGGLDQPLDDPAIGGGLAGQQVLGDARVTRPVARRAARRHGGGLARALRWRAPSRCRRGRSDARTSAAGRARGSPRSPADRPPRLPRALRGPRVAPLGAGRSARGPPALARAARHAPAADGAGGEPSDRPFRTALPMPPSLSASTSSRTRNGVPRVTRRQVSTTAGSGAATEPRLQELGNGGSRQRRETDHIGGGIGRHGRKQLGIGSCLARTGRHDERDVQLFEPREQEGQVTQGRGVCPVRVVDDQAERTRRRPGSRTASRGRGGSRRRDRRPTRAEPSAAGCARKPEQAGRNAGSALQQIGALELRCLDQRRLEQADAPLRRRSCAPARFPATEARAFRPLPPPSAPPRAAPSCRSRPALRPPGTCRAPCEPRPAPTRSAPAPRSARAAVRWPRPRSCASSLLPMRGKSHLSPRQIARWAPSRKVRGVSTVRITVPAFEDRPSDPGLEHELITRRRQMT